MERFGIAHFALRLCKLVLNKPLATIVTDSCSSYSGRHNRLPDGCGKRIQIRSAIRCHTRQFIVASLSKPGALKKELVAHLRRTRTACRPRHHTLKDVGLGKIANAVSIRERPAEAEDRAVPGHWEGDLSGDANSQIATLVERQTRYVMLVKVARKDSQTVVNALIATCEKNYQTSCISRSLGIEAKRCLSTNVLP